MKTLYIFTILLFLLYIAGSCNDDQQKLFSGSTTMHLLYLTTNWTVSPVRF